MSDIVLGYINVNNEFKCDSDDYMNCIWLDYFFRVYVIGDLVLGLVEFGNKLLNIGSFILKK